MRSAFSHKSKGFVLRNTENSSIKAHKQIKIIGGPARKKNTYRAVPWILDGGGGVRMENSEIRN